MPSITTLATLALATVFAQVATADFIIAQGLSCSTEGAQDCTPEIGVAPMTDGFNCNSLVNSQGTFTQPDVDSFDVTSRDGSDFCSVPSLTAVRACEGCAVFNLYANGNMSANSGYCYGVQATQFLGANMDGDDETVPYDSCIEGMQDETWTEDMYCVTYGLAKTC